MNKIIKRIILGLLVIATLGLASYGAYTLYNIAVEDAAQRIKAKVAEGVAEGASKGVRNMINPLNWFRGIFGHKKKTVDNKAESKKTVTDEDEDHSDEESDD
jgi:hypothetical protein